MADYLERRPAFIIRSDRADEFLLQKADPEIMKQHAERAEFFVSAQKQREDRMMFYRSDFQKSLDALAEKLSSNVIKGAFGNLGKTTMHPILEKYVPVNKKTEAQIVEALRMCKTDQKSCRSCAYFDDVKCRNSLTEDAADLIEGLIKANQSKDKHLKIAQEENRRLRRSCIFEEE